MNEPNLGFYHKINNLTDRALLCFILLYHEEINLNISEIHESDLRSEILKLEKNSKEIINNLESMLKIYFVPEQYFEWLEDNLRAQIFTLIYVRRKTITIINNKNKKDKPDVFGYLYPPSYGGIHINKEGFVIEEIYDLFDNYRIGVDYVSKDIKIKIIEEARFLWSSIYDQWEYEYWLEDNNENQIRWTKNYLIKNSLYIDNIYGINSEQQYKSIILASLDLMEFKDDILKKFNYKKSSTKEKFINRMKASWDQKKRRDAGEEKKPYHLALTKHTKARLDKMAEINNVKPEKLLEDLINLEYEECYLDKNGEEKFLDCSKSSQ